MVAQVSEALSTCQAGRECKVVLKAGLKVYIRNSSTLIFLPPVPANRQMFLSSHIKIGDFSLCRLRWRLQTGVLQTWLIVRYEHLTGKQKKAGELNESLYTDRSPGLHSPERRLEDSTPGKLIRPREKNTDTDI